MRIALPWPSRTLSPNARVHWGKKASAVKKYRHAGFWAAKEKGIPPLGEEINLRITFIPPTTRARDEDNFIASIKSGLDGIAQAWGVDDSRFRIKEHSFGKAQKPGCVIVEVVA
jgi:crossover junction endodeoxyribonuclease RusA